MEVGLAGVGWRDGEKMQTIVTELKKKKNSLLLRESSVCVHAQGG